MLRKKNLLLKSAKLNIGGALVLFGGACVGNPKGATYDVGFCIPRDQYPGSSQNGTVVDVLPPYPGDYAVRCGYYPDVETCAIDQVCYFGPFQDVPAGSSPLISPDIDASSSADKEEQ